VAGDHNNERILQVDQVARTVQYHLSAGESLAVSKTYSPIYYLVVTGGVLLKTATQQEEAIGANTLIVIEAKEEYSIRAGDQPAVLLAFQFWAPAA
jgi:hypothetical protein